MRSKFPINTNTILGIGHLKFGIGNYQEGFTTTSSPSRGFTTTSSHSCGFTLIELLIVFGVIGFLSTIGLRLSINFSQKQAINTATQDVRSMLYSARSQTQSVVSSQCNGAQFTGMRVEFCNATDKNGNICSTTNTPQCQNNGNPDYQMNLICAGSYTATLQKKSFSGKIAINPDNCSILFQPFGNQVTGSGNVAITGYNKTATIVIQANGVIQ